MIAWGKAKWGANLCKKRVLRLEKAIDLYFAARDAGEMSTVQAAEQHLRNVRNES